MESTFDTIRHAIAQQMGIPEDTIELLSTTEDLEIDDIDSVEIIMELEDEFDIEIKDANFYSVGTLVEAIDAILAESESTSESDEAED